jgi:hypothetical protein
LKEAKMNPTEAGLKVKRDAKGKRPQFYKDPQVAIEGVDHAMSDRLDTIERICAQKNLVLDDDIEAFHPDQNVLEIREARRQEFYTRLYYLARKDASEMASADTEERYEKVLGDIAIGDV